MEKDIGRINKNENTDVVIRIDDFGGKVGLTIREFVTGDRYTGFTKAGTRIAAENFPKFKEMINSISENDLKVEDQPSEEVPKDQETLNESEGSEEEIKVEKPGAKKEDLPDY